MTTEDYVRLGATSFVNACLHEWGTLTANPQTPQFDRLERERDDARAEYERRRTPRRLVA